ncbi:hypothetical protein EVAR_58975_1 [Eumeta japonica]|uniref:Uncharacterized protein n=1 Tax=Eumeta variegata TaxID=151549 RepID=A0A4C1YHK0_EUMVA|nr:hypothetical protein EVAR_58975_1 [Eumeta japonica]
MNCILNCGPDGDIGDREPGRSIWYGRESVCRAHVRSYGKYVKCMVTPLVCNVCSSYVQTDVPSKLQAFWCIRRNCSTATTREARAEIQKLKYPRCPSFLPTPQEIRCPRRLKKKFKVRRWRNRLNTFIRWILSLDSCIKAQAFRDGGAPPRLRNANSSRPIGQTVSQRHASYVTRVLRMDEFVTIVCGDGGAAPGRGGEFSTEAGRKRTY